MCLLFGLIFLNNDQIKKNYNFVYAKLKNIYFGLKYMEAYFLHGLSKSEKVRIVKHKLVIMLYYFMAEKNLTLYLRIQKSQAYQCFMILRGRAGRYEQIFISLYFWADLRYTVYFSVFGLNK